MNYAGTCPINNCPQFHMLHLIVSRNTSVIFLFYKMTGVLSFNSIQISLLSLQAKVTVITIAVLILESLCFPTLALAFAQEGELNKDFGKHPEATIEKTASDDYPGEIIDRLKIEKLCKKVKPKCWASDIAIPICASNGKVYKNPGVLICAQICDISIEFELFCRLTGSGSGEPHDPKDVKHCLNCPNLKQLDRVQVVQRKGSSNGPDLEKEIEGDPSDNEMESKI